VSREYILAGVPTVQTVSGQVQVFREVKERAGGGPWQVAAVVSDGDSMAVLEALRRAYTDGREDQERWKDFRGWLQDRIRSLEADARDWRENDRMAETFRAKADAYRSALVQMTELEAGQ
jgi:hypothetical protein